MANEGNLQRVRLPVAWQYNNRESSSTANDVHQVNVMHEPKENGEGVYTLKRPGMTLVYTFRNATGQGLTFYNNSLYAVVGDYLELQTAYVSATNGAAWTTGVVAPWEKRGYAQVVVLNGVMYLLGGYVNGVGFVSDVWWSPDGVKWKLATGAAPWGGRYGFAAAVLGDKIYVMGGYDAITSAKNDIWSSPNGVDWTLETAAAPWSARGDMGMVTTANGIFLLGGADRVINYLNDIWFSSDGKTWTQVNVTGTTWSGRAWPQCFYYHDTMFVTGGTTAAANALNDCWASTDGGQTWTQKTTSAFSIGGLAYAGAVVYGDKMWCINGYFSIATFSNNVYSSTDGITWTLVTASGPGPASQAGVAVVFRTPTTYNYESIWFFSGLTTGGYTNTCYYGTLNLSLALSTYLSPAVAGQPFQFNSFVEGTKLLVKNQSSLWVVDGSSVTLVTDLGYPATTVPGIVVLGGYAYVMDQTGLIRNCKIDDPYHWPSLNALGADYEDDPGVALAKYQNYVVAFGTYTVQFFYDAGRSPGSPLLPYLNANQKVGCAAAATIANVGSTLVWVSQSQQVHRQVVMFNGLAAQVISTPFIEKLIGSSSTLSAISTSSPGHLFYILTYDNAAASLVYDFSTKSWLEWKTWITSASHNVYGAFSFVSAATNFQAMSTFLLNIVNGEVYRTQAEFTADAGFVFTATITTDKVDGGNNRTKFWGQLEIIGEVNAGETISVQYSDDDYATFSTARTVDMGTSRPVLYRNGKSRRRAIRLTQTDALPMRLEAIELTYEQGI